MHKIRLKSMKIPKKSPIQTRFNQYQDYLISVTDFQLNTYKVSKENRFINPNFKNLNHWIQCYISESMNQLVSLTQKEKHLQSQIQLQNQSQITYTVIKDENRNAIIPTHSVDIEGRRYFLSIKGCGAYEDMFFGGSLNLGSLQAACRDPNLVPYLSKLTNYQGIIMSENWMGESPYGAQGEQNGFDELEISKLAKPVSILGAYICPLIGLIRIPKEIEVIARKFFWYRTYSKPFYQSIRLVPSRIRLYFESTEVLKHPDDIFTLLGLNSSEDIRDFELNFIRSGISLLSLFTRSAIIENESSKIRGLVYQDVWLDKDAILGLDGVIHFADLEGLIFQSVSRDNYPQLQRKEWQKLAFEFLYGLNNLDRARRGFEKLSLDFSLQRQELAILIQEALESDQIASTSIYNNTLYIKINRELFPSIEIPFLENIYL
ncbi:MAG: hypothetical protein K9W44_01575 [Candidatus Lokiarchaeota archaeon]|nr:hypothetical protein [Candidatus Harpocratesius repetitus]